MKKKLEPKPAESLASRQAWAHKSVELKCHVELLTAQLANMREVISGLLDDLRRQDAWRAVNRQLSKELEEADRNVLACLDVLAALDAHQSPSGRLWFGEPGSGPACSRDAEKTVARLLAERAEVRS